MHKNRGMGEESVLHIHNGIFAVLKNKVMPFSGTLVQV